MDMHPVAESILTELGEAAEAGHIKVAHVGYLRGYIEGLHDTVSVLQNEIKESRTLDDDIPQQEERED